MFSLGKIQHLLKGGRALDLGTGDFETAKKLLELAYTVDAVDIKPASPPTGINFYEQDMLDFEIKNYDFIVAQNSLPFSDSRVMINKIAQGLNFGGITYFTLFGPRDEWKDNRKMTFIDYDEAIKLIEGNGLSIYRRGTEEGYGPTRKGDIKYWHTHFFICTKNPLVG